MKIFSTHEIREAAAFALAGGQALHLMSGQFAKGWGGPACFQKAKEFAHLMDQDESRLIVTARRLGVRRIVVARRGQPYQHVDLCGKPLERAKQEAQA